MPGMTPSLSTEARKSTESKRAFRVWMEAPRLLSSEVRQEIEGNGSSSSSSCSFSYDRRMSS